MGDYTYYCELDSEIEMRAFHLVYRADDRQDDTSLTFAPEQGSNLFSFSVGGTEYLFGKGSMGGPTRIIGTPILYPTPNRVRNATFAFDGRTFTFEANDGTRFLHGLVRDIPWEVDEPVVTEQDISVTTRVRFLPGTALYERFPVKNTLELTYRLQPRTVQFEFSVSNDDTEHRLPFGLAIHPFFNILGPRESVTIQVPATKWMEAENLMPTGRLVDIEDGPADIREPTSLAELDLDDVFYGLTHDRPQIIRYGELEKKLTLTADDFFSHSVVFTPQERPFFCVENQSCSTDAHNLYAEGYTEAASLSILEPGESLSASITLEESAI